MNMSIQFIWLNQNNKINDYTKKPSDTFPAGFFIMAITLSTKNYQQNKVISYLDMITLTCT